jgi:hypothetical protein
MALWGNGGAKLFDQPGPAQFGLTEWPLFPIRNIR